MKEIGNIFSKWCYLLFYWAKMAQISEYLHVLISEYLNISISKYLNMDETQPLNHLSPEAGRSNGAEIFTYCGATASRCRLGGRRRTNLFVRLGEVPLKAVTTERPSPS